MSNDQSPRAGDGKALTLAQALEEAAQSLETISKNAGRPYDTDGYENLLEHHDQVRGYAASRAGAARAALAAAPAAAPADRERFEAYFAESRRSRGAGKRPNFARLADGTYADDHTQRHWWTWQQAGTLQAPGATPE